MAGSRALTRQIAPEQLVSCTARLALGHHIKSLHRLLRYATNKANDNVEDVHHLRVATRRAVAVIDVFAETCPRRRAARLQKRFRRLRRLAGPVRDFDVLIARLQKEAGTWNEIDCADLIEKLKKQRGKAHRQYRKAVRDSKEKSVKLEGRELLKRIRWRGEGHEPLLRDMAPARIAPLLDEFVEAGRSLTDPESLHAMRVCGKRLRYSFEILGRAFPKPVRRQLSDALATIQTQLGEINDHVTAAAQFERFSARPCRGSHAILFARLLQQQQERIEISSAAFRQWWVQSDTPRLLNRIGELIQAALQAKSFSGLAMHVWQTSWAAPAEKGGYVESAELPAASLVQHNDNGG